MKDSVSKVRARKIRSREKQAGRSAALRTPFWERPACAALAGLLLWLLTLLVLNIERVLDGAVVIFDGKGDPALFFAVLEAAVRTDGRRFTALAIALFTLFYAVTAYVILGSTLRLGVPWW
jgi:type VI protein secretion system component VasF